jgi:hypothetical protein
LKTFVNIASQKYSGDVTLYPAVEMGEFFKILTNPTEERFGQCIRKAELYTFRQLAIIKNHCDIEFTLDECVRKIRGEMILKEEIPLLEASAEDGSTNPSYYLTSRIRSWSSEQFQLLQKSLDSHIERKLIKEKEGREGQQQKLQVPSLQKTRQNTVSRSQSTLAFNSKRTNS